jgi:hypothetical protein
LWHQLATKNQQLEHQMPVEVLCCCHNLKREEARLSLPFSNCSNNKKVGQTFGVWQLVFSFQLPVDAMKET